MLYKGTMAQKQAMYFQLSIPKVVKSRVEIKLRQASPSSRNCEGDSWLLLYFQKDRLLQLENKVLQSDRFQLHKGQR